MMTDKQAQDLQDLKEQMQENLLTYFDAITLGTQAQHTEAMDGMCDIVIKTINEHLENQDDEQ